MSRLHVTGLAKQRNSRSQETCIVRSVRAVATLAVLTNWSVLIEERTTFVLMALVALFIHLVCGNQLVGLRAVWIVAGGALHPSHSTFVANQVRGSLELGLLY